MKKLMIRTKLLLLMSVMILGMLLVGLLGIGFMSMINKKSNNISGYWMPGIIITQELKQYVSDYRIYEYMYIEADGSNDNSSMSSFKEQFEKNSQEINENIQEYKSVALNEEDTNMINLIKDYWDKYEKVHSEIINVVDREGSENSRAVSLMAIQSKAIYDNMLNEISRLVTFNMDGTQSEITDGNKLFSFIVIVLLFIIIFVLVFSILFGSAVSNSISKPIERIKDIANKVANGDLSQKLNIANGKNELSQLNNSIANVISTFDSLIIDINKTSDELEKGDIDSSIDINKYKGDYKKVAESINRATKGLVDDLRKSISCMSEYGKGNFDFVIERFPGKKSSINEALDNVQINLNSVAKDINYLTNSILNGDFSVSVDSSKYEGNWQDIVNGLNSLIKAVAEPISEVASVLNMASEGNMNTAIEGNYKGNFEEMKIAVNRMLSNISAYITEISSILTKMSNQELNVTIDRHYIGDFKAIKIALDKIIESFNQLIGDIASSSEQIATGANQISKSSISLAQGATEQAGSVEQLNLTMNNLLNQSKNNTENSLESQKLSILTKEKAESSGKQMENMLTAMEDISNSSKNINNIIKVIDDIAFQTNILALNAAVEAARAGQHGKGFAVVAEEVRNLASRSQNAVKETTELTKGVVSKISEGSDLANLASSALFEVVNYIEKITELSENAAVSSKEQENAIKQVYKNIEEISAVTQNNSATSEESAAASQELASQSELFKSVVGKFILKNSISE